jgi:hypothetical protein
MVTLKEHFTYLEDAVAVARAAPLSARKAMLAAMLIDAWPDRVYAAGETGAEDVLAYRAGLAKKSEALALVFALCTLGESRPRLVTEAVEVPIAEYHLLSVQDYMVSLYNANTVQRVRIAVGEARHDVHEVLVAAVAALAR